MWLSAVRLSETGVAFARAGRASDETVIAFARSCACGVETVIAFADEKELFWARFSAAEVMAVSRWPASAAAEVMAVSQLPRGCVLCAKKFSLLGLMVGASAIKFALRTKNGPKSAVCGVAGRVFRGAGVGVPRGLAVPSRPTVPSRPYVPFGISPGGRRGPGAWRARRRPASRRSGSPVPPTRRPLRSSGTSERSRGR